MDESQIVLAAEITTASVDWFQLAPMVAATLAELARAGSAGRIQTALADAQYWNEQHMDEVTANQHVQVLIPPDGGASGKQRKGWTGGRYSWMRYVLNGEVGNELYRKRNTWSSRYSATPAITEASHDSSEEAARRYAPSGD